jgi:hypothetical protein
MAEKGKGEKKEEGGTSWMPDFEKLKPEMPDFEKFKPDFDGLKPEKLNEHKDKLVESFSKPAIDKLDSPLHPSSSFCSALSSSSHSFIILAIIIVVFVPSSPSLPHLPLSQKSPWSPSST